MPAYDAAGISKQGSSSAGRGGRGPACVACPGEWRHVGCPDICIFAWRGHQGVQALPDLRCRQVFGERRTACSTWVRRGGLTGATPPWEVGIIRRLKAAPGRVRLGCWGPAASGNWAYVASPRCRSV